EQIEVLVEDIKQICSQEILEKELDHVCSLLFDKETGINNFLQKIIESTELSNGKASALALLSEFLQKIERKVVPYAIYIKDTCVSVYSLDRTAKVKNSAIPVIIKVLELSAGSSLGQDLNIDKLIQKFFNELTKPPSKLASTG
ncbi:unnamed protein product, partial [Lymnaea stagnalis]